MPFAGCECSHNENISANSFSSADAIHLSDLEHLFVRLLELQRLYRDERDIKITPIYYGRQPHGLKRDCCGQTQVTGDTAHESNTACADQSITTLSLLVLTSATTLRTTEQHLGEERMTSSGDYKPSAAKLLRVTKSTTKTTDIANAGL
jgi:hypothetical protein